SQLSRAETRPQPRGETTGNPAAIYVATPDKRPTTPQAPSPRPPRPSPETRRVLWRPAATRRAESLRALSQRHWDHETRAGSARKEYRSHEAWSRIFHRAFRRCAAARPARS